MRNEGDVTVDKRSLFRTLVFLTRNRTKYTAMAVFNHYPVTSRKSRLQ